MIDGIFGQKILDNMNYTLNKATTLVNPNYKVALEFGVAEGTSTGELRSWLPDFKIYGFDSFRGLPEDWIDNGIEVALKGAFDRGGSAPSVSGVEMVIGWFKDTVPEFAKQHPEPVGLIHMDCDIYSGCKDALYNITNLIVKDTIIIFDDWCVHPGGPAGAGLASKKDIRCHWDGVQKAFYEWAMEKDKAFEVFPIVKDEVHRRIVKINN